MTGTAADPAGIEWTVGLGADHPGGSGGGQVHQLGAADMASQFHAAMLASSYSSSAAEGGGGGPPQASVAATKAGRYHHHSNGGNGGNPHVKNPAGSFNSSLALPPALRIHLHAQALDLLKQLPSSDERHKELPPKYHSVYPLDQRAKLRSSSGSYGYPTAVYKAVTSEGESNKTECGGGGCSLHLDD